jgi:hypothetical protein
MRTAILAAMVIVAFSSNPFIHIEVATDKKNATEPVSGATQTPKGRDAMQAVRMRIAQRRPAVIRMQEYGN